VELAILSLRKKIFLFTAVVVVAVFPTALYLVQRQVQVATLRDAERRLIAVASALQNTTQDRVSLHTGEVKNAAQAPALAAALARHDAAAIRQIVHDLHLQHLQIYLVTAPDGSVVAADGLVAEPARVPVSIEPFRSLGGPVARRGLWVFDGRLYEMVGAPIAARGGARLGALLVGIRLGDISARLFQNLGQVQLVLLTDARLMYSPFPRRLAEHLRERLIHLPEGRLGRVELAHGSYLAWKQSATIDFGGSRYTQVVLRSLEGANELAYEIGRSLLAVGLGAGLLVVLFAWMGARRITQPLQRLSQTMSEMARTGELKSDFPSVGGDREIGLIEDTFRRLIVSLEESQQARERSYVEAVGAVVTAADARDHETTGHSFRVAYYAVALARALGLRGDTLKAIEWGSLLHDVGKMVVPDDILRKVGPLTEDEWHIMRQHPNWGFDMLAEVGFLQQPALEIVYSHHERWDGAGYPRGLAGEDIPLAARIFAVVDTYDAITSDRPYRRAHSHQAALAELMRVSGKQLDPRIVETFFQLPEVELRRLRELCKRIHPGLSLPSDLLDTLVETMPETRKAEDGRGR
jgi:putative nucleotidyltransferase with HDIG domain